ncbi:MAG: HAMP domain-containing histidine kinase [Deltaproteobacteria bacterium]|nr:HAMP domain-containing histidine kinase [Deltaproteobacteria bacterium]
MSEKLKWQASSVSGASTMPEYGRNGMPGKDAGQPPLLPSLELSAQVERCLEELVRYYRHSMVGRRLGGIIHHMNTPLQVLSFHLDLLERKSYEERQHLCAAPLLHLEELRALHDYRLQKMQQLHQEVDTLLTLVQRLVHHGMHEDLNDRVHLDLNRIFQEELELYEADPFFKHQVDKEFSFVHDSPPLTGHYIDFSQSFRNLVDNALEAMQEAEVRVLRVRAEYHRQQYLLRIGDTGLGISAQVRPRLFEPFVTTKGGADSPRGGLGLFMVRRLLDPYGARFHVESRPGETWFTVAIPMKPAR